MTTTVLELGYGDVGMAGIKADDGKHGVIFHSLDKHVPIGEDTEHGQCRTEDLDQHIFLQITSKSKESLQVLIDKLEEAKGYFDA